MLRRVFVSYAREDGPAVAELVADLRALDHEVWVDRNLDGGQDWWDRILDRIRWCDAFVHVLSAASLRSAACAREYGYATAVGRPVLPVRVADVGPEGLIDDDLSRRHRIEYAVADKAATLGLLGAVQRLAPAPALPEPLPEPPEIPLSYLGRLRAELEGAATIDFDRQLALHGRLAVEAEDPLQHAEVAALVAVFLGRRELASWVERQLRALHAGLAAEAEPAEAAAEPAAAPLPGEPEAVTLVGVERKGARTVLTIRRDGAEQRLRIDASSGESQAVSLNGRYLRYTGSGGWSGHGVEVSMTPAGRNQVTLVVHVDGQPLFGRSDHPVG